MRNCTIANLWQDTSIIVGNQPWWAVLNAGVVIYIEIFQTENTNLVISRDANLAIRD